MTSRSDRSDALVMFGLTGDLGRKKLFPAIYELAAADLLVGPVVGIGRSDHSDHDLREMFRDALADHRPAGGGDVDSSVADGVELSYIGGDSTGSEVYTDLAARLDGCEQPLVYAALPPDLFGSVATGIAGSALPDTTRLVVEKPFGGDAESARTLHRTITGAMPADQLFIVDHFLAKAAIENILTVRTVNPLVANSLDATHVDSIDIVMHESGGVDGRGSFYEGVGAIRDVVQNHLMQMLATVTMEAPADGSDDALQAARLALLRAVRPVPAHDVVLGQYEGYRRLDDVPDDSDVETFASLVLDIDNDRWRGVPVTMRTGKRLSEDRTEAVFHLRNSSPSATPHGNRVRFTVKPNASVSFDLDVIEPSSHETTPVTIYACGPEGHGELGDYAVMFDNAMNGDTRHFAQIDGIVAAWRILEPILAADHEVHMYEPGTDGPEMTPLDG